MGSTALWIYAIAALIPLLLMVANSFRTTSSLYSNPLGAPWPIKLDSYRKAWTEGHFGEYFTNSLLVTVGAVTLSTVVSTMAAYALARARSRIFTILESVFISGLMLPIHLAILPIFYLLDGFGLVDSRLGLMLVYAASGVPFSIFVLTTFFRQLPPRARGGRQDRRRQQLADVPANHGPAGAPRGGHRGGVPLRANLERLPVPVGAAANPGEVHHPGRLTTFFGEYSTDWSSLFAGLVIATVPLIVLFLVATKQIVAGLTAGMSK